MHKQIKIKFFSLFIMFAGFGGIVKGQDKMPIKLLKSNANKPLIVYVSGDGGWNDFSEKLISGLNKSGYSIIGLDSKKYFWSKKTPAKFGLDLQTVINQYSKDWNKTEFIIIGYSIGADVGAFLPANLNATITKNIKQMVLLSPGFSTSFEVKLMDMMNSGGNSNTEKFKVYPELQKVNFPVNCIFGSDDDSDFKLGLKATRNIHKIVLKGNHHFNDDIPLVLKTILNVLE